MILPIIACRSQASANLPEVSIEDILAFWLGPRITSKTDLLGRFQRWFRGGPAMDDVIRNRFEPTVVAALDGRIDGWVATPRGRLGLIVLLDQMSRNIYRDTPDAFKGDVKAQRLAVEAFDRELDQDLDPLGQFFLGMPFAHAENIDLQHRGLRMAIDLGAAAPHSYELLFDVAIEQSKKYLQVIERFGRFPHRNAILGRTSSQEELAFLQTWKDLQPSRILSELAKEHPTGVF